MFRTPAEIKEATDRVQELIGPNPPMFYSNWLLEGVGNQPMQVIAFAGLYPKPDGNAEYQMFWLDADETEFPLLRRKILDYEVKPHVLRAQLELSAKWATGTKTGLKDAFLGYFAEQAIANRVPLVVVVFAKVVSDKTLMACIYHPPQMPTGLCLEMMQRSVKNAVSRTN